MSMFCYQCQETAGGIGCKVKGMCGKTDVVANLQDLLIFVVKGIAVWAEKGREKRSMPIDVETGRLMTTAIFTTITNADRKSVV